VRWLVKEEARQGKTNFSLVVHLNSRKALDGGEKEARLWMEGDGTRLLNMTRIGKAVYGTVTGDLGRWIGMVTL